ncbi:MAG: FliM/FliN family flagellar motor switch protein [Acidobacteria bacterium]|nr:FliM/FliN family flagellar motor switch protein [Acidobacteriota bacterium]
MAETEPIKTGPDVRENMYRGRVLAQKPWMMHIEEHSRWPVLSQLTVPISAEVAFAGFKVRDLLALKAGQIIASEWQETEDVPVKAGQVQVGWSEFEVVDQQLLIRLTRLA